VVYRSRVFKADVAAIYTAPAAVAPSRDFVASTSYDPGSAIAAFNGGKGSA
jgi:hypothetical protein